MGKMRGAKTEIGQFVQWMGRKCRNHNPLEELGMSSTVKNARGRTYTGKKTNEVFMEANGSENTLVYIANGRAFEMIVTEIDVETAKERELVEITY